MKLTTENVEGVFLDCLFEEGEAIADAVRAEGIVKNFGFHPGRLAKHREDIASMLDDLPDEFKASKGGGWTFLNACRTQGGEQWTDYHRTMEALFCLGIAAGEARWVLPRDLWSALPGGMPYVVVGRVAEEKKS